MELVDSRFVLDAYMRGWSPTTAAEAIDIRLTATRLKKLPPTESKEVKSSLHLTRRLVDVTVESPQFARPLTMTVKENELFDLCKGLREEGTKEFKVTVQKKETKDVREKKTTT